MLDSELNYRFTYREPSKNQVMAKASIRAILAKAAVELNRLLVDGREKSVVMTKLEEACFWAEESNARKNIHE